ncbi:GPI-anchor transamidase-like isoform X1 [Asterias rubens]|uniref:GPI-anchor transamidase-like isoform X1 n=1 Tax=Asterias rubens TaxID=7604 RepID=UPI0014554EB9|nr:GPI-anchor transamidase-like isoform X1 [Asterias rubens]XP_033643658.1 GPI-anchor transamidase-like isoform X1 [Asterias rubens]
MVSPCATSVEQEQNVKGFFKSGHTNNWAVLVCTSRFWFNYRHVANTLSIYRSVKRLGIPDSQIILMLADDMACNARNPRPATVFNNANQHINVYGDDVEVDYRGYEVTVENFIRVLTGRLPPGTPRSKRLMTDDRSNILVYMTGHGGENFLKFQDAEEISNVELAHAFEQMWQKKRYHEVLYIIDTCQAVSMFQLFYSPNILSVGSSQVGEDSLSHHVDPAIGVYVIDRYTYYALEFLEKVSPNSKKSMADFFQVCPQQVCRSTPGIRTDLFRRDIKTVPITDFFGSVRNVELSSTTIALSNETETTERVQLPEKEEGPKDKEIKRFSFVEQLPAVEKNSEKGTYHQKVQLSSEFVLASSALLAVVVVVLLSRIAS